MTTVVEAPTRAPSTLGQAVAIVTVGKLLGAALRGPVGAIFGGFMGVVFASGTVPPLRKFVWIARRDGKEAILGPFLLGDTAALRDHAAMKTRGYEVTRLVQIDREWMRDLRTGTLPESS